MKRLATTAMIGLMALAGPALARQDDMDVNRLNSSLNQLASDPTLGTYAQAEQALAHAAIDRLDQASRSERPHALYLAERRVDLAKAAAQLQDARDKLDKLDREHAEILLDASRREAEAARMELERQRMQYQMAQEEAARLQQQGMEASQAAEQARAEAERAKKLAAAQSRVARAARREAEAAAQAARAMRSQMQGEESSTPAAAEPAPKKSSGKGSKGH
jgi:hypothetical protein